jgi:hypothetical protein
MAQAARIGRNIRVQFRERHYVATTYHLCYINAMKWQSLLELIADEPVFPSALL